MRNHAPFCWGKNAQEAFNNSEILEFIAELAYISITINNKSKKRFYQNGIHQYNEEERLLKGSSEVKHESSALYNIFSQYEILKKNTSKQIYNISNNSLLDVFDYVKLSDVIK